MYNKSVIISYIEAFMTKTKSVACNVKDTVYSINWKDDTKKVINVVYEKGSFLIVFIIYFSI